MKRLVLTDLDLSSKKTASQNEIQIPNLIQRIPHNDVVNGELGAGDGLFTEFWSEVWRVLKPGGAVIVTAPYYTSVQSVLFPRQIAELTFMQLNAEWRKANNWPKADYNFTVEKMDYNISPEFQGRAQDAIQYHAAHAWNVVTDISVILRKPA